MIVDVKLVQGLPPTIEYMIMEEVKDFQRLGYRVDIQYVGYYEAMIIARECNWIGNNS